MTISLIDLPGLSLPLHARWQVKVITVDGKSPALKALHDWQTQNHKDYKRIMKAMEMAAMVHRVANRKHVAKNTNPDHGDVFEFIAYTGTARLMFFYDEADDALIICTNGHDKGGNQDAAFGKCAAFRKLYLQSK